MGIGISFNIFVVLLNFLKIMPISIVQRETGNSQKRQREKEVNSAMDEEFQQQQEQNSQNTLPNYVQPQRALRLMDLLYAVRKRLVLIAVCAMIGLIVGVALSIVSYMRGEMAKQYAITSAIAVTSQDKNGLFTAQSNNPNSNDIYLAENISGSNFYNHSHSVMIFRSFYPESWFE